MRYADSLRALGLEAGGIDQRRGRAGNVGVVGIAQVFPLLPDRAHLEIIVAAGIETFDLIARHVCVDRGFVVPGVAAVAADGDSIARLVLGHVGPTEIDVRAVHHRVQAGGGHHREEVALLQTFETQAPSGRFPPLHAAAEKARGPLAVRLVVIPEHG